MLPPIIIEVELSIVRTRFVLDVVNLSIKIQKYVVNAGKNSIE